MLASFALRAQVASSRKIKATRLPLIASATLDSDQDTCLIVGIPPITESMPKRSVNLFLVIIMPFKKTKSKLTNY